MRPIGLVYGHTVEYKLWPVLIWEPDQFGWILELHFLGWHGGISWTIENGWRN